MLIKSTIKYQISNQERAMGFEPTTFSLARRRSTNWTTPAGLTNSGQECRESGSNWRHRNFQSRALPTELSRPIFKVLRNAGLFYQMHADCQAQSKMKILSPTINLPFRWNYVIILLRTSGCPPHPGVRNLSIKHYKDYYSIKLSRYWLQKNLTYTFIHI